MYEALGFYPLHGDAYGDPFCADCAPKHADGACTPECCTPWTLDEAEAITSDMEADAPTHCTACEALIHHSLTPDGAAYVWEALEIGTGRPEILAVWRDAYAREIEAVQAALAENADH